MVQADSLLGRLALAARPARPWFRITAPPRVARFLVAAGAQAAPATDAMKVTYSSAHEQELGPDLTASIQALQAIAEASRSEPRKQPDTAAMAREVARLEQEIRQTLLLARSMGMPKPADLEAASRLLRSATRLAAEGPAEATELAQERLLLIEEAMRAMLLEGRDSEPAEDRLNVIQAEDSISGIEEGFPGLESPPGPASQELALAVLGAQARRRQAVSALRAAGSATLEDDAERIVAILTGLREAMQDVKTVATDLSPTQERSAVVRVHGYEDAQEIGTRVRTGQLVIMDLTKLNPGEARRLTDFAAGLITGLGGTLKEVRPRIFALLRTRRRVPRDDPRLASHIHQVQATAETALDTVEQAIRYLMPTVIRQQLDMRGFPGNDSRDVQDPEHLHAYASRLEALNLPLDLSGVDLTGVDVDIRNLADAIWTSSTTWPNDKIAAQVKAISEELPDGRWQVRTGTEREPTPFLPV